MAKKKVAIPAAPAPYENDAKNKASVSAKNTPSAPVKDTGSAPAKNEPPVSSPAKDAAPKWWQWKGLLEAFMPSVHGRDSDNTSHASGVADSGIVEPSGEDAETVVNEAPTEGSISTHEEERKKRRENQSWYHQKKKNKIKEIQQQDKMVEVGSEVVTPDLVARYAVYCRYRLASPRGKTVCHVCVIDDQKDFDYRFSNNKIIEHFKKHQKTGLPCNKQSCRVIVCTPRDLTLHTHFCHDLAPDWFRQYER